MSSFEHGPDRSEADARSTVADETYFAMRSGLVMLIVLLGISLGIYISATGLCDSISAYYYTPVRPVFVGVLCAVGAGLIFYRARNDFENTALDIGGFAAFIVAFVPTGEPSASSCTVTNVPDGPQRDVLIATALPGLLIVGLLAVMIGFLLLRHPSREGIGLTLFALVALVAAAIVSVTEPHFLRPVSEDQRLTAHNVSAIALFVAMFLTVAINSVDARKASKQGTGKGKYFVAYTVLGLAMAAGVIALGLSDFRTHIFYVEAVGIGGFGVFWVIQTIESWPGRRLVMAAR